MAPFMYPRHLIALCATSVLLASCAGNKGPQGPKIEGERISILSLQEEIVPDPIAEDQRHFALPAAWDNAFWPQSGGYPNRSMQNLGLNTEELQLKWDISIGEGSNKRLPLTAQPIATRNAVYALDSEGYLGAYEREEGDEIWRIFAGNPEEGEDEPVISGGIGYSAGRLFVTSGYNEVLAVHPKNGRILWRADIKTPARAAPTAIGGRVYINTVDNRLLALNTRNGKILWEYESVSEVTGVIGSAPASVQDNFVIPAFSSGEVTALRAENGSLIWSENLRSFRRTGGLDSLTDISAAPVIDKDIVFVLNVSGRLVAIDVNSGRRLWHKDISGTNTPWVSGSSLYVLSKENSLISISRDKGYIRWVTQLPAYEDPEDQEGRLQWTGPVMAGSRLFLLSSAGDLAEVNPKSGETLRMTEIDGTFYIPPIVAGRTLYLLSEEGTLYAYE